MNDRRHCWRCGLVGNLGEASLRGLARAMHNDRRRVTEHPDVDDHAIF